MFFGILSSNHPPPAHSWAHGRVVEALGVQGHLAADASEKASLPALLAHTLDCSLLWEVAPTVIPDSLQTDSA